MFIPQVKEVKYFCTYYRWYDFDWYLSHFVGRNAKWKGDSSGTYFLLPNEAIELIRCLVGQCKIIIVFRNPVERLWSHFKHDHTYKTSTLLENCKNLEEMNVNDIAEYVTDFWQIAWSDYVGALKRWSSAFSKNDIFIGFYDEIQNDSIGFLDRIHRFLDLKPECYDSAHEIILKGREYPMPREIESFLYSFYRNDVIKFDNYLKDEFDIIVPSSWKINLSTEHVDPMVVRSIDGSDIKLMGNEFVVERHSLKDSLSTIEYFSTYREALSGATRDEITPQDILVSSLDVTRIWQEPRHLEEYKDYSIVHYGTSFYAIYKNFIDIKQIEYDRLVHCVKRGLIHAASTPIDLKRNIDDFFGDWVEYEFNENINIENVTRIETKKNRLDYEMAFESPPRLIQKYRGFNIILYRNSYLAFSLSLGHVDITRLTHEEWSCYQSLRLSFESKYIDMIKSEIDASLDKADAS